MAIFYKGILFLALSAFLGEGVEFLVNLILAKELGKHGLGLYMSILPSIYLLVLLSSFELPVSISKFVAEKEEKFHRNILYHAITITIIFTCILLVVAMALIPFISVFNGYHPYTRWLIILLVPVISFTSVARGYFMGRHQMGKIAIANFLRKSVQLVLLFVLFRFFQFDSEAAVLIAIASFIGSEIAVFLYLCYTLIIQFQQLKRMPFSNLNRKAVRKNLMAVSVPTTGLRLFSALTGAIQPFLIKAALVRSGLSETIATEHFGMLMGVAVSIGFFPAFIAHSLMTVLIPAVSKTYSNRDYSTLQKMLSQVMMLTFLYGVPAVVVFYIFAPQLTSIFFESSIAAVYLQMLWPFFLFHFFVMPMQAFLIGLGLIKETFIHAIWSTIVSFAIIIFLAARPEWRMEGVIISMNTGSVLLALMHYLSICKKIGVSIFMKGLIEEK
ncbi:oligosaccharide flippase family protein [Neobacillus sp. CF12]|jgi:stage V sporulation protein B|uniref:oligosaccharide flippase family protein n=1 Tax=Neobacillus sp. CF12 TaxID=3055864 RepID=UPI0025A09E30|nr:oligosaccharide flippase family protein [Neobacillus sp. CF12]MDM5328697.1 oligosaccharide flippase family protein [Neobacillus sp. CF12]